VIRIEAVDPTTASDETLRAIYLIEAAADATHWDGESHAVGFMRYPPAGERRLHWLALEDGEPIGFVRLGVSRDSLAWLHLHVLPDHRRRGVGRALFDVARAAAGDRPIGGHHSTADGAAFADALGAKSEHRDVRSELRLRDAGLPEPVVPAGYELRSWFGAVPEELVVSFASARNAIDDAPGPAGQTYESWTVARVRGLEDALERRGRSNLVSVALAGDEVVAITEIRVSPPPSRKASTEDTATVAEHRGRGLGQAVKLESLRRLQRDRPDVEIVTTLNAEENGPMRAVNTKLGFVPVVTLTTAVLAPD
jgi:GNAT superfamily N-acetyltransferase